MSAAGSKAAGSKAAGSKGWESAAAFGELIEALKGAEAAFMEGPRAVEDEQGVAEGYHNLLDIWRVAVDCYVKGDPDRPEMLPIAGPQAMVKWGGDNTDADYHFAAIDPSRTYRVRGEPRDSAYLSLTVYGGPDDGRWSNRVVSVLNTTGMERADDGSFEVVLSAEERPGNWMQLDPDAVALVTRDYRVDPVHGRPCAWSIETEDAPNTPPVRDDADTARRIRCAANFLRDITNVFPLAFDPEKMNTIEEPFAQPLVSYGWVASDAAYAMGAYELADDEVLILEGRSPGCAFWNVCLWNVFLQTYDARYGPVTRNGGQVELEPDGSWRLLVSARDPGLPNWIWTAGHPKGRIWFRWFLAEETPKRPSARVVKLADLAG
jgi:hypothetical protein